MTLTEFFNKLKNGARWDVGVSINRSNALPLDANSVFKTLEDAQNYAAGNPAEGTLANAYPGQVLAVVTETETNIYYIDANMQLKPVGNTKEVMDYIGQIPETSNAKTIIEYINSKTEGIATTESLAQLQRDVENKVNKVDGKGLSTNDLTNELKAQYDAAYQHSQTDHAPSNAQENVIEKISVNNVEQSISEKGVNISVPTKTSDLTNDSGYLTEHQDISGKADKENTYTKGEVDSAVQGAKDYADGLVSAIPEQTNYAVTIEEDTSDSSIQKRYIFKQLGSEIGRIDLAKELVVTSGSVKEVVENDVPYTGAVIGDKYIELVIANQDEPIYVPAKDLVDIYTAAEGAEEVQLSINGENVISAQLTQSVKDKLNKAHDHTFVDSDVNDAIAKKHEHTNKDVLDRITSEKISGWDDAVAKKHEHTNKELLDSYTQTEANLADAVSKKHSHENSNVLDGITAEKVSAWDAAEKNLISSVEEGQFDVDVNGNLTLKDIAISKVTGLSDALANKAEKGTTLAEYGITDAYTKTETEGKIQELREGLSSASEATASVAQELTTYKGSNDARVLAVEGEVDALQALVGKEAIGEEQATGLIATVQEQGAKLSGIEAGAQVNKIEGIKFNGVLLDIGEDKIVDIVHNIAIADLETLGIVKSSEAENGVSVANDGTMSVNSLNVNKLVQTDGDELIMNGGSAAK